MTELSQAERTILMKCLAKRLGEVTHREVQVGEKVMLVARDYGRERERVLEEALSVLGEWVVYDEGESPSGISRAEALEKAKDALAVSFGEPEGRCPECGKHLPWHKSSCSQFQPEVLSERSDTEPGETEEQSTVDADLTMPTDLRNAIRIMRQLMCSKGGEEFIARHVIHPFGLLLQPDRVPSDGRPTDVDDYGDPEAGWAGMPPDHGPGEPSGTAILAELVSADEIKRGDTIWAPNDGDWLLVDTYIRLDREAEFRRKDGSIATFDRDKQLLRRVGESNG